MHGINRYTEPRGSCMGMDMIAGLWAESGAGLARGAGQR
jgi:hypothetical protein